MWAWLSRARAPHSASSPEAPVEELCSKAEKNFKKREKKPSAPPFHWLCISLCIYVCVCMTLCTDVCVHVYLSCLSFSVLSICLSVFLLIYLFIVRPSDSISLSIYQAVCFLFCHFICLCVCFFCLSISLYTYISIFSPHRVVPCVCAMHILIKTCSLLGRTHGPKTSPCRAVPPDPGAACSLSPNPPSSAPSTQLLAHLLPQATSHRLMSILELEQVSICDREAPSRWCTHQGLLLCTTV